MRSLPLVLLAFLPACGGAPAAPDAGVAADGSGVADAPRPPDAAPAPDAGPAPDAHVPPAEDTVVFLNFEGVSMHKSDWTDPPVGDAKINTWPWLAGDADVPPYRLSDPDRAAKIAEIVSNLTTFFAPWRFDFVTERPASGEYMMVVFGGTGAIAGFGDGTLGTVELDCGNAYPHDVGFVFEPSDTVIKATDSAIFAITLGVNVSPSTDLDNCDCAVAGCTLPTDQVCSLSHSATTQEGFCFDGGPQDQLATLDDYVGLR